jgi:SPP1 family predicted phage head-tail adaptor
MRTGDLRHKIIIQEKATTSDSMGGFTETFSDLYPTRAAIWPIRSAERLDAMKLELQVDHRILIRHPKSINITADMRVKWHDHVTGADKYFNIYSITNPDKRNLTLELLCSEEV